MREEMVTDVLEESHGKSRQTEEVLGGKRRECLPNPRGRTKGCPSEIVKEGRRVIITHIDLVPQTWNAPVFKISGY